MDHLLSEPTVLAVPFFVLFIGLELVALRVLDGEGDSAGGRQVTT